MRFTGVTLDIVPLVKPISPIASDKADESIRCLCTSISSGAVAYY